MKKSPDEPIQDAVASVLDLRKHNIWKEAKSASDSVQNTKAALDAAHAKFLQTGIAFIPETLQTYLDHWASQKADSYFRTVARENNRLPLIAMEVRKYVSHQRRHVNSVVLTMPKQKRLKNVMAGMLLVAEEAAHEADAFSKEAVGRLDSRGTWRLYFNGDRGRDIFDEFRERCHTDPVMRCVLRLT